MKAKGSFTTYILLVAGIIILVNFLSDRYFVRLDLTADRQYTLSDATKDILNELEDPVTVKAYFTKDLPPDIAKTRRDFRELLVEYHNISRGKVMYEFIDPSEDEETEQLAMQTGIRPLVVNVREKDQVKQQKVYLGALLELGDGQEVIPFVQPGAAMEYTLSSSIKKLAVTEKPTIGIIQGHGEPKPAAMSQVVSELSVLYNVQPVNINDSMYNLGAYQTLAIVAPKDTLPPAHLAMLDRFLAEGGDLFIGLDKVEGNFQKVQGTGQFTGLETWLQGKGLTIENSFVIDANCGNISVRQQSGNFTYSQQVPFPYIPIIGNFADHPITNGLEAVVMQFASPILYTGDTSLSFTPLMMTSEKSGSLPAPLRFNVQRAWTDQDFPQKNIAVGGILEGNISGNQPSRIIVVSDGGFPVSGEGRNMQQLQPDNISLLVNSIDYLSDDTGLIDLRTKSVTNRPLDQIDDAKKTTLKLLNFFLPILIIIVVGIIRAQIRRNTRTKRMQEGYV